jgi:hypothetical protein
MLRRQACDVRVTVRCPALLNHEYVIAVSQLCRRRIPNSSPDADTGEETHS